MMAGLSKIEKDSFFSFGCFNFTRSFCKVALYKISIMLSNSWVGLPLTEGVGFEALLMHGLVGLSEIKKSIEVVIELVPTE